MRALRRLARAAGLGRRPGPVILMYHRVATPASDPWALSVSPERFEAQMRVLARARTPLPMAEFARRAGEGRLPRDAAAVTFDDGYLDNLRAAKPALERHGVPATVFLATDWIGSPREYWWDELARLLLEAPAPLQLELDVGADAPLRLDLSEGGMADGPWLAWEDPRTERERAFAETWAALRRLSAPDRAREMDRLRQAANPAPPSPGDLPMTAEEVGELVRGGLVEVGAHTLTHPVLPWLPEAEQRREVEGSRAAAEALAGAPVTGFAYPHGEHDAVTRAAVEGAGLSYAVTTREAAVRTPADAAPFALPRLQALSWDEDDFAHALEAA